MIKRKNSLICLALCLLLCGCGAAESPAEPSATTAPVRTATATAEADATFLFTPSITATPAPTFPVLPTAQDKPSPTFSDKPTATPDPPSAQEGVNIRHEGFGENAARVIVLDPGHQRVGMSEKEPNSPATGVMKAKVTYGTQGVATGIPEYELNIAVALYLRDALLEKGYTVIMTHEVADVSMSNIERTTAAGEANAAVLLHIHANGSEVPASRGAMTICTTKNNPACGALYAQSRRLAGLVLDAYCEATGIVKEYVWETDTMTGLNWSRVPCATIELGYMSNAEEDRLMATDAFRRTAANAIAQALEEYLAEQ